MPSTADAGGVGFVARFPRLAKFRAAVRDAVGLPAPRVAGSFVSFPSPAQPTQQTATTSEPKKVAAAEGEFIQVGPHRVPTKLIERARAAGIAWGVIFKILLTAGIDALQQLLADLGK
jgi:hypothetical protein